MDSIYPDTWNKRKKYTEKYYKIVYLSGLISYNMTEKA